MPRAQQAAVQLAQQQAAAALGHTLGMPGAPFQAFNPLSPATLYSSTFHSPVPRQGGFENQDPYNQNMSNRCIYIGSIPPEAEASDVFDAIRGGLVAQLRYLKEKHYAVSRISYLPAFQQSSAYRLSLFVSSSRLRTPTRLPTSSTRRRAMAC